MEATELVVLVFKFTPISIPTPLVSASQIVNYQEQRPTFAVTLTPRRGVSEAALIKGPISPSFTPNSVETSFVSS